jgi:hypothetical protein
MSFEASVPAHAIHNGVYQSLSGINYSYLFYYEKKYFNQDYVDTKREWMSANWHLSVYYAAIYIVTIFTGQYVMKSRPKFDLRRALIAWNMVLALFSIAGAVRIWPEFIRTLTEHGIEHSICSKDYAHGVSGCWAWLFILSKVPELFDTVFIVLRKQELIFLHWYHHATVLIYCWYSTSDFSASGRWFVLMNFTVHAFMYSYYAFRALRFQIPKWVNIAITSGQISQMIFGIYVNCVIYMKKSRGEPCGVSDENIRMSFLMYFSYFLLFFKFFYTAYISPPKNKRHAVKGATGTDKAVNGVTNGHCANGNANGTLANGHAKHAVETNNNNIHVQNNNNKKKQ